MWEKVFATNEPGFADGQQTFGAGAQLSLEGRSLMLLRRKE